MFNVMSLTDTTPFVELVQRWAKKLAIFWILLVLIISSFAYINNAQFRADLNLIVPEKIQIMFSRNFELVGCTTTESSYSLDRKDNYGCYYGRNRVSEEWIAVLILPTIGLLVVSWLITFFSRRMGEYRVGKKAIDLISEHNYLQAYKEIEEDNIQSPELWAKAFALSDGDEDRQQSIYVELRTRQLDGR